MRHHSLLHVSRRSALARRFVAPSLAAALVLAVAPRAAAQDRGVEERDSAAYDSNEGWNTGFGPMIIAPRDGGPLGAGLDLDLRYGIGAGPFVFAPGGRLAGYYYSQRFVGLAMPTARLTLPIGPLAPYGVVGAGAGSVSNPTQSGMALMGGGGLMLHFGRIFGLGVEATYQKITETDFRAISVGPLFTIGT